MATKKTKPEFCSDHVEAMKGINEKLDGISQRQTKYIEDQGAMCLEVSHIKGIVTNGLGKTVEDLAKAADDVKQKIQMLDNFTWFIKLVNDFKEGLVRRVFKYAFFGGVIALIYTFIVALGSRLSPKLITLILG
jgi:hypothetical protein